MKSAAASAGRSAQQLGEKDEKGGSYRRVKRDRGAVPAGLAETLVPEFPDQGIGQFDVGAVSDPGR